MDFLFSEDLKNKIIHEAELAVKNEDFERLSTIVQLLAGLSQLNSYALLKDSMSSIANLNPDDLQGMIDQISKLNK